MEYVGLQAVALDDKVPAKDAAQEGYEMADIEERENVQK